MWVFNTRKNRSREHKVTQLWSCASALGYDNWNTSKRAPFYFVEHVEKTIAIPDDVLKALTPGSCESEQVICQLKESFQLDQSSFEQPEGQTKQLIRCFVKEAKLSNRDDVIIHLREMTPAGTTGVFISFNNESSGFVVESMFFSTVFIVVVLFSAFKICEVNILTCRYCCYLHWAERVYDSVHILSNYGLTEMF